MSRIEIEKKSNIVSVATLCIVIASLIYDYGVRDAEIESNFKSVEREIEIVDKKVDLATKDRIHKATVEQMFNNQQVQIDNIKNNSSDQVEELKKRLDRIDGRTQTTNDLVRELLAKSS